MAIKITCLISKPDLDRDIPIPVEIMRNIHTVSIDPDCGWRAQPVDIFYCSVAYKRPTGASTSGWRGATVASARAPYHGPPCYCPLWMRLDRVSVAAHCPSNVLSLRSRLRPIRTFRQVRQLAPGQGRTRFDRPAHATICGLVRCNGSLAPSHISRAVGGALSDRRRRPAFGSPP